jgi:hypothetical protein
MIAVAEPKVPDAGTRAPPEARIERVETSEEPRGRAIVRSLGLALLYTAPALLATRILIDPDIFWHLKTGEWIVEHRAVPWNDPFSQFGHGKAWIAYSWLFELLIYGLYRAAGWTGILIYRSVLFVAITIALHRLVSRRQPSFVAAFFITIFGVMALLADAEPRPWLVTILFFIVELDILDADPGGRAIFFLPVLFVVWANVHVQFVYGLLALATYALFEPYAHRALAIAVGAEKFPEETRRLSPRLITVTGACFLATLVNPYHVHLYRVIYEYGQQSETFGLITELGSIPFRRAADWCVLGLVLGAAVTLGWRRDRRAARAVLLFVAAFFSFRAVRDVWFVTVLSIAVLARVEVPWLTSSSSSRERRLALGLTAIIVGSLGAAAVNASDRTNARLQKWIDAVYPAAACDFIEKNHLDGPIYNSFNWGGYLIWKLPRLPVSMDGRTNLHGPDRIRRNILTYEAVADWDKDSELHEARMVIADPFRNALFSVLARDPRWEEVYHDEAAGVFVARGAPRKP